MNPIPPSDKMPTLDVEKIKAAQEKALKPELWTGNSVTGNALFVPERYVIDKETNMPKKVIDTSFYKDSLTGLPIPNKWFEDHKLPLSDLKVQAGDPDKDGFLNEDEWRGTGATPGAASTDPNNAESHPPYYTKLFLKKFIRVPFLLKFQTYDGDPKKNPETMNFQINTLSLRQPSEFLKLGDTVPKTTYKLEKFEFKEVEDKNTGTKDVSELTVLNTETNEHVVLILTRTIDSPDSYGAFIYEWPQPAQPFTVKKLGTFALSPDLKGADGKPKLYKLLDINEKSALIQTPTGEKVTVSLDPRQP